MSKNGESERRSEREGFPRRAGLISTEVEVLFLLSILDRLEIENSRKGMSLVRVRDMRLDKEIAFHFRVDTSRFSPPSRSSYVLHPCRSVAPQERSSTRHSLLRCDPSYVNWTLCKCQVKVIIFVHSLLESCFRSTRKGF
jgi:hypothetical protein